MKTVIHTPSAGGVIIDGDKVLAIYSENRAATGFPKGTIEPGDTIEATAIREVKEETGYTVRILDSLGESTYEFDSQEGIHYRKTEHNFLLELADREPPVPDLQHDEDFVNLWLTFDEARAQLTHKESLITLERAIAAYAARNV